MPPRYPYKQLNWYPHLSPDEAALWDRFIGQFPDMYDECSYDVKVGKAPPFVTENPDPAMQQQAPLYQYKIDVVGYKGDQTDVIELKKGATMRVFGQVNGYRQLYRRDVDPASDPKAIVVTDSLLPEMDELAIEAGVQIVVV